ncbi:hypothetical protein HZS_3437, partial [Henneguya salminicola]
MPRKQPSQSCANEEDIRSNEIFPYISHCDLNSVFFCLEDNIRFFKDKTEPTLKSETESQLDSTACACHRYHKPGHPPQNELVVPCDDNFVVEIYGSICDPSYSQFFTQGYPANYYCPSNSTDNQIYASTSSSFYLTIYDHIIKNSHKRGNLFRTSVIPSILNWDHKKNDVRFFRFEHVDYGSLFYREYFYHKEHANFVGVDPSYGPFAISVKREIMDRKINLSNMSKIINTDNDKSFLPAPSHFYVKPEFRLDSNTSYVGYRIIARFISIYNLRIILPECKDYIDSKSRNKFLSYKQVVQTLFPRLSANSLCMAPSGIMDTDLLKFDEDLSLTLVHKVGIIFCGMNQTLESEMYGNDHGTPMFEEFLSLLGDKVALKNFSGYPGMLDTKNNLSGTHSVYTEFHNRQIMFHVSTLLPNDTSSTQQITKKRFIGNDIVTVIFQDENAPPFNPKTILSHFQHIFIIVRGYKKNLYTQYKVAVFRVHDVPMFGPPITEETYTNGQYFREFILTKIINSENACQKSHKFMKLATRTRYQKLLDMKRFVTSAQNEKTNRFAEIFRSGSQRSPKISYPTTFHLYSNCANTWASLIYLKEHNTWLSCTLSISVFCLSIVCQPSKDPYIIVLNRYLVAWRATSSNTIRIYHRAGSSFTFKLIGRDADKTKDVIDKLSAVSNIVEAKSITFSPPINRTELVVNDFAIVKKIINDTQALKKLHAGDQILEIENIPLNYLSSRKFYDILYEGGQKRLLIATMNYNISNINDFSRSSIYSNSDEISFPFSQPIIYSDKENLSKKAKFLDNNQQFITKPSEMLPLISRFLSIPKKRETSVKYFIEPIDPDSAESRNEAVINKILLELKSYSPPLCPDNFIQSSNRVSSLRIDVTNVTK